jgi:hypothetical protein
MENIEYSEEIEILLKEEGEKCESMAILHHMAYLYYNKLSNILNIPTIILSALIGFLLQTKIIPVYEKELLGFLSIVISIIKAIDNYFSLSKTAQSHYMISTQYYKVFKFIQIQLSLSRNNRIKANDLIDIIINDVQNIKDSSPLIPKTIINKYKEKYKNYNSSKPNIVNGLTNINIIKPKDNTNELYISDEK